MSDSSVGRAELLREIAEVSDQQSESLQNATFVGWTRESELSFRDRGEWLSLLNHQLATLGARV